MKRHFGLMGLLLALLLLSSVLPAAPSHADPDSPQIVPNEYLVQFVPGTRAAHREAAVQGLGGHIVDRIGQLDVDLVRFRAVRQPGSVQAAGHVIDTLAQHPSVEHIQPNYVYTVSDAGPNKSYLPFAIGHPAFVPNDPSLSFQYAWANLEAYKGWLHANSNQNVVVAVVDTGIQLDHPDLKGKLVPGYDFVYDDADPDDANGHGTHVAGIVGAVTNNGVGVAGTCLNCKLLPVRVLDEYGSGSAGDVAQGIVYAADRGAKVINLSLGIEAPDQVLKVAVEYAWNKGAVVLCAAGNGGDKGNMLNYPAYYDACEAVGATNQDDSHALFSQWGQWVDIVAPGSAIYSTHLVLYDDPDGVTGYATISGTSMATPFVSGVAGLLAGQGLTNQQIRNRLRQTADPIGGTGTYWSNGRLNMWRALRPQ